MSCVLATLGRHHGAVCASVMLLDTETNQLGVIASHGLDEESTRRVKYRSGEGITGRVFQTGKPMVVPQTSHEPLYQDRHGHHLPPTLQTAEGSGTVMRLSLESAVEAYERDIIQDAWKTTRGNRKKAAKLLDITERIIGYKVKKFGIDCERYHT